MGVWIEIWKIAKRCIYKPVTPYVGVWIEMQREMDLFRECFVTPYVGVWIEINRQQSVRSFWKRHPLCGGVD